MKKNIFTSILVLSFFVFFSGNSVYSSPEEQNIKLKYDVNVNAVIIPVFALDKKGNPVFDLKKKDLVLYVEGNPVKINSLSRYSLEEEEKYSEKVKKTIKIPVEEIEKVVRERYIFILIDSVFNSREGYRRTKEIAEIVVNDYSEAYNELKRNFDFVGREMDKEEIKFAKTLEKGEKMIKGNSINGQEAFNLFQTFGYPVEMTKEIANEKNIKISVDFDKEYSKAEKEHQELSRTASAGKFKGGLADASEETKRLHTAAHLLLAALRQVLGDHVEQKGSNITAERLRFDFSHDSKMTDEEKEKVEKIVNQEIEKKLPVACREMTLAEAKKIGAQGVFESKYGEKVNVYTVGNEAEVVSREICGGPHVKNTSSLGKFKIKKEQSSSAGVRRIKAILG